MSTSAIVRRSPEEDQELRELGFKSQAELQESSSSSSSQKVPYIHSQEVMQGRSEGGMIGGSAVVC